MNFIIKKIIPFILCFSLLVPVCFSKNEKQTIGEEIPRIQDHNINFNSLIKLGSVGQILLLHDAKNSESKVPRFATSITVIEAPIADVRKLLLDFKNYKNFVPQVVNVKIDKPDSENANSTLVTYQLGFKLPVGYLGVDYTLDYRIVSENEVYWTLAKGDMDYNSGRWELIPLSKNKTMLSYTAGTDFKSISFIVATAFKIQPELAISMPLSTNAVTVDAYKQQLKLVDSTLETFEQVPIIESYNAEKEILQLADLGNFVFVHNPGQILKNDIPVEIVYITSVQRLKGKVAPNRDKITQFNKYPDFFEQAKYTKSIETETGYLIDWKIKVGLGLFSLGVEYQAEYEWDINNSLSFKAIKGDLPYLQGRYEWLETDNNDTLFFYTMGNPLGKASPSILKLGNLIPNQQIVIGIASTAVLVESIDSWLSDSQ